MRKYIFLNLLFIICFISITNYNSFNRYIFRLIEYIKSQEINEINNNLNVEEDSVDKMELNSYLCTTEEKLIYSFKIIDSNNIVSVITSTEYDYLVCRIGTENYIKFEFPQDKTDSWNQFTYLYYFRGGGKDNLGLDLNYLLFETDLSKFNIYYEYSAESESIEAGIKIIDKKTSSELCLKADENDLLENFLFLKESNKIKIDIL